MGTETVITESKEKFCDICGPQMKRAESGHVISTCTSCGRDMCHQHNHLFRLELMDCRPNKKKSDEPWDVVQRQTLTLCTCPDCTEHARGMVGNLKLTAGGFMELVRRWTEAEEATRSQ